MSEILSQLYASGGDDPIVCTLEVSNPAWPEPVRVCTGFENIEAGIETGETVAFRAVYLGLSIPARGTGPQDLAFGFDNIEGELDPLIELADEAQTPTTVTYRQYVLSDLSAPQERRMRMRAKRVTTKGGQVQIQCGYLDLFSLRFTRDRQDDNFSPAMRYVS